MRPAFIFASKSQRPGLTSLSLSGRHCQLGNISNWTAHCVIYRVQTDNACHMFARSSTHSNLRQIQHANTCQAASQAQKPSATEDTSERLIVFSGAEILHHINDMRIGCEHVPSSRQESTTEANAATSELHEFAQMACTAAIGF